jgi:arabinan endo-1,5-alpha-L-arabinosidase
VIHPTTGRRGSKGSFFTFVLCLAASGTARSQTTAVNPLKGDLGVHDPAMIKAGSTYYIFSTGNGVSVKTSTDRVTWKNAGRAFATAPAWHAQQVPGADAGLWAPDISFREGKYWLYYSISTFGSRVSAIGLATATTLDPASGATQWQDQGMVVHTTAASDHNAIDPNIALDEAGIPWLFYGSFWTGIKAVKLDPATGKPAAAAPLISTAQHTGGIEAAFVIRHGGYCYQFVSWDACCKGASSTYNIRVGRAVKVDGAYADAKGVLMSAGGGDLIDKGDARWKGPGHNAIFVERDTVFLVNHAYDAENNGTSILWIRPLYWTPQGWPTLDKTVGATVATLPPKRISTGRRDHAILFDPRGRRLPETGLHPATPIFPNRRPQSLPE